MSETLPSRTRWLPFAISVLCLSLVGFALNAYLSWRFFEAHAYRSYDVIFDADPNFHYAYLVGLSGSSLRHPIELLLLHPLSVIALWVGRTFHLRATKWLVILLGPAEGGLKTALLMYALRRMNQSLPWIALIAALDICSLSRLTVGSLPESFPLSAAALTALFLLAAAQRGERKFQWVSWVACGMWVAGVTITNIAAFVCVLAWSTVQEGSSIKESARRCVAATGLAVCAVACLYGASVFLFHARAMSEMLPRLSETVQQADRQGSAADRIPPVANIPKPVLQDVRANRQKSTTRYFHLQPFYVLRLLPLADTYAFTGPKPTVVPIQRDNPAASPTAWEQSAPWFGFVMPESWSIAWIWPMVLVMACLLMGTYGWFQLEWRRQLAVAALLILAFNAVLHSIWGANELYLYVLHWQPALLILLSGGAYLRRRYSIVMVSGLLLTEVVLNVQNLQFMLTKLPR